MRSTSSMSKLVTAIYTSAALAARLPYMIEPLNLGTRDSSTCPPTYETQNGMNFTTYCNMNISGYDAYGPFTAGSMQECMERCSRYWGDGEGCYGIVYDEKNQCYIKNSNVTANTMNANGTHSALAQSSDMVVGNKTCPYNDMSTHSLGNGNGLGYTFHCDKSVANQDYCFDGFPTCLDSPFQGFYHADSFEECVNICVKQHPLCLAVVFNPGLEIGFANCWPKTGFPSQLADPTSNQGTFFTATITSLDSVDSSCPTTGTQGFNVHCGQSNQGTNITSVHKQNITSCMEDCAGTQACISIVFDSTLAGGYDNCYLQNTTSIVFEQANATYAQLSGTAVPTTLSSALSSASAETERKRTSSKTWIAGPVIGGIAAIALIAGTLLWRRRKSTMSKTSDYAQTPVYGLPSELSDRQVGEMENSEVEPGVYAMRYTQELPT